VAEFAAFETGEFVADLDIRKARTAPDVSGRPNGIWGIEAGREDTDEV
jgi:hypothetical protein